MPVPLGSLAKIAWEQESSYGTMPTTIQKSLPFISESIKTTIETARVDVIMATRSRLPNFEPLARMSVSGDIEFPFYIPSISANDPFVALMKACMGSVEVTTDTSVIWSLADVLPSLSLFVDRDTRNVSNTKNYFYYAGVKVNQFTITGEENGIIRLRVSVAGQREEVSTSGQTITIPTLDTAKFWFSRVYLYDGSEAVNAKIRSFEITVNHNLTTDRYFNNVLEVASSGSVSAKEKVAVLVDLPEGRREVTGRLELYFDNTRWYEKFLTGSLFKVEIIAAGQYISTGTWYAKIELPKVMATGETPNVSGPNPLNFSMSFTAYQDASSNDELRISILKQS